MKTMSVGCIIFLSLFVSACTTPPPTYKYLAAKETDPKVSFESDFDLHTNFSVNSGAVVENRCSDFKTAGYLLKKDSIFIYDKANRTLQIRTPADRLFAVSAYHHFSDGRFTSSCGPLTVTFTPEQTKTYVVKMNLVEKICFMSVQSVDETGKLTAVESKTLPACKK